MQTIDGVIRPSTPEILQSFFFIVLECMFCVKFTKYLIIGVADQVVIASIVMALDLLSVRLCTVQQR